MSAKEEKYAALLPAVQSLMSSEEDEIARMANLAALIHSEFGFWWTGFYRVAEGDVLVLGPFQGPLACTRIPLGKGVCGTAWAQDRTVVVPDVSKFPGHIACSSESRSEIVVPVRSHGKVVAVLDIDSRELGTFDRTDAKWLEKKLGAKPDVELQHIKKFYKAEEYHQDYLDKNPGGYCHLSPELFKLAAKYRKK